MLWNEDMLFIHVPKTGGMMITEVLLKTIKKPIYYCLPPDHFSEKDKGIILVPGRRHEFLDEASEMLKEHNRKLEDFKYILTVIRNPYDLEVSRFAYLRHGYEHDKGNAQTLALSRNFEDFATNSDFHGRTHPELHRYYTIDGIIPKNLVMLRFEHLEREFRDYLKKLNIRQNQLQKVNVSHHKNFPMYVTDKAEKEIFKNYQWIFDQGYYKRWTPPKKINLLVKIKRFLDR